MEMLGVEKKDYPKPAIRDRTTAVVTTEVVPTNDEIRNRPPLLGSGNMVEALNAVTDRGRNIFVDANRLAEALFGSHMAVNIFLTGVAWQSGFIPISLDALPATVAVNGVENDRNLPPVN